MILLASSLLNTIASKITKTKCYPYEISAKGLKPNTVYNIKLNGTDVGSFTKPYGKDLGEQLLSTQNGTIHALVLINIDYATPIAAGQTVNQVLMNKTSVLTLVDPAGRSTSMYIPILQRVTG